jgi:hypothetical protein
VEAGAFLKRLPRLVVNVRVNKQMLSSSIGGMEDEEEELWNSWTSRSDAAIILDGRKLNDVFSSIRNQLEFLRKQQKGFVERIESLHDEFQNDHHSHHQDIHHKVEPVQEFRNELLGSSSHSSRHNTRGSFVGMQPAAPPPPQVLDAEELQIILDRIHTLETDVRKHDLFGERLDRLENSVNTRFAHMQAIMEKLTARVDANSAMEARFEKRFAEMEGHFAEKLTALDAVFDEKLSALQDENREALTAAENTCNSLRELVQISEIRLARLEKEQVKTADAVRDVRETVDYFPVKYLDNIRNDIVELYMVKASKDDLNQKADNSLANTKADQAEIVRMEKYALELANRLDALTKDLHEGFGTVDTKLEKRIDKVALWCLKHLRKEFKEKGLNGEEENRDGTDIGKVKCLVCDQVVPQQRETEIVHGGPPMKNVIKPHHIQNVPGQGNNNQTHGQHSRPRSASPPPTRGRGFGTGPSPAILGTGAAESGLKKQATAPGTLPSVNAGKQQTSTTHSKLVKLGAQPIHGASNPAGTALPETTASATPTAAGTGFSDEVDPTEEFNYRVETDLGSPQRVAPTPAPAPESPPMRIAHALLHSKDPAGMAVSASQPTLPVQLHQFHVQQQQPPPDSSNYFRDLEE